MGYIPRVLQYESVLSDDVKEELRLLWLIQSRRREMHATLIHSVGQRKGLPRRWRARQRNSGVFYIKGKKKSLMGGKKKKVFRPSALQRTGSVRSSEEGWNSPQSAGSPPGFKTSNGGRGLARYKKEGSCHTAICWWSALVVAAGAAGGSTAGELCIKPEADLRRMAAGRQRLLQLHAVSSWRALSKLCPSLTSFFSFSCCHCSCFSPPGL